MKYLKMEVVEVQLDETGVYDGYFALGGKPHGMYVIANDVWVVDQSGSIYAVFYGLDTYFPDGFKVEDDADKTEGVTYDEPKQQLTEPDCEVYDSSESSQITQKFLLNVLAVAQDPSLIKSI